MYSRKLRTHTGYRLEVVDEILSLLVSRPVTFEVERREAGLFVSRSQQSRSKCSNRQIREEDQNNGHDISTYSMFRKFVQPEHVVVPTPADPKLVHPAQEIVLSEIF